MTPRIRIRLQSSLAAGQPNFILLMGVLLAAIASTGCVNLDKQTTSTKKSMVKTPSDMMRASNMRGERFLDKVTSILPRRTPKNQTPYTPIDKNDPTRLDNMPDSLGPDVFLAAARMAERQGNAKAALEQYGKALNADGANRNALIGLARLHHRVGDMESAIRIYRDAMNTHRNDAVIMNDLGLCYAKNNQLNEAISMLEAATQTAPAREMYVNNLAAALVEAGRAPEAVARLSQHFRPEIANYRVGFMLDRAGQKSEATNFLSQALAINPDLQEARTLLDSAAPQVSSLPSGMSSQNSYAIPVSRSATQTGTFQDLQRPDQTMRPVGEAEPVAPGESPSHLQQKAHRFGPFGYVPRHSDDDVQVVSYVEDVIE